MATIIMLHRFIGESLVTVAVIGVIVALFAANAEGGARRWAEILFRIFGGLLSLQWLLGVVSFIALGFGPNWTHPIFMTAVLAAFHIYSGRMRKGEPQHWAYVGAYVAAAVLIYIGIQMA